MHKLEYAVAARDRASWEIDGVPGYALRIEL